jgi:energy-converting hydrogenase Eha subunit A
MDHPAPHESATSETPLRSREVAHQARRRRLMRVLRAVLLGCVVGAYTLGALNERVTPEDENDLLPVPWEALIIGASFTLASLPTAWSIVGRVLIPVPAFYIFLTVLLGKNPPLPFYAAFAVAGLYSALLTALSRDLSERPTRPRLGSSRAQHRAR